MRLALSLALTVVLCAALALPSGAEDYLVTDTAEDANGLNPQGLAGLAPTVVDDTATPVNARQYDILGVRYVTLTETSVVDGQEVTEIVGLESRLAMTLDPNFSPLPGIVRLVHTINGCDMFFQYYGGTNGTNTPSTGNIRVTCEGDVTTSYPMVEEGDALEVSWDADAGEIVWAYTFGTGAAADGYFEPIFGGPVTITPGTSHTRFNSGRVTAPVFDEMDNPAGASFTVGEDVGA